MTIKRRKHPSPWRLATVAAWALVLGGVNESSHGVALGPVAAITPYEVNANGFVGRVFNPVLSGRGESAGVYENLDMKNGWVLFDVAGPEDMTSQGVGITVSGNSCASLSAVQEFIVPGFVRTSSRQI